MQTHGFLFTTQKLGLEKIWVQNQSNAKSGIWEFLSLINSISLLRLSYAVSIKKYMCVCVYSHIYTYREIDNGILSVVITLECYMASFIPLSLYIPGIPTIGLYCKVKTPLLVSHGKVRHRENKSLPILLRRLIRAGKLSCKPGEPNLCYNCEASSNWF